MAMVGLFCIAEDGEVYVGGEPEGYARGVRLTRGGLEGLGTGQGGRWSWADVRAVVVRDVRIRSSARLLASTAVDLALTVAMGGTDVPGAFEVHVETADGTVELDAYAAPALGGYVQSEYDLSIDLLDRFVAGTADVGVLAEWGRTHAREGTPRREEREALLREWAGDAEG
ncbi:hypothetical protein Sipo8835_44060 [Streptomyces ipomoeae]|jgi:hypothetical protein|uniref:Uncharacterized protein n=4 Tax=Streptomyces ipomoeae TaxID=103232 RepID=L1L886_9ACTN|nr:hypothetical protein [Streptomyces ipomoeae]EKX69137.1 hypothetical protein STRIP9103_05290 [Streptomyces ipomoeae 91-03]MDX2695480.1 hypothetical protein [Streptomyces ipomoeae]MDX2876647.1 hypothetical protein [Streptomyces ipomoeae]TQE16024.1 hypothetical protein Sipo8835_44060 [Streptomyces ipomoeae]TQE40506.1 hypothetical protein Sipo7851_00340 [Streptomyces ipomoeae]